jgi:PKD repeat protein
MMCRMRDILLLSLVAFACSKTPTEALDAGQDAVASDATAPSVDASIPLTIDFTVENCPSFDPQTPACIGTVPFTVRFVPMATTTVTNYLWDFGDSPASVSQGSPSHTYPVPGSYTVALVARGPDMQWVTKSRASFVVAKANTIGAPCGSDSQCERGLTCLCAGSAACAASSVPGLCATPCASGQCEDGSVCAGLQTAATPAGATPAPWQDAICLRACESDGDCEGGLRCRTLPPGPAGSAWVRGCFADTPADVGQPCMDTTGALRDDLCSSGMCADLGAKGLCTMSCAVSSCPPGSDCAQLGDGRKICLRPCVGSFDCSLDPLLTCVAPTIGDLGYQLVSSEPSSSYCAPTPCIVDESCAPTGRCLSDSGGGHCVAKR